MNIGDRFPSRCPARLVLAGVLALLGTVAQAQTLDFGSCVRIDEQGARLACYDRAAGRTPTPAVPAARTTAPAAPAVAVAPPARVAAPLPANPVASFGATERSSGNDALTAPKVEKQSAGADVPKQIEAKVASVRKRASGEQVLTLDNGQVWEQTEVRSEPQYEAGDTVIIRRGMLGSFLLTMAKGSPTTRVRRVS